MKFDLVEHIELYAPVYPNYTRRLRRAAERGEDGEELRRLVKEGFVGEPHSELHRESLLTAIEAQEIKNKRDAKP